jgi:hypothetical protein
LSEFPRITKGELRANDPLAFRDYERLHAQHFRNDERQDRLLKDSRYTSINVASVFHGAAGAATSTIAGLAPNGALVGNRRGLGAFTSGAGVYGWAGALPVFPQTLTSTFIQPCVIDKVGLVTASDTLLTVNDEPTLFTLFTLYGLTGYDIQYMDKFGVWTSIKVETTNANVFKEYAIAPVMAQAVRCICNASVDGFSRINSLEAWLAK